MRVSILGTIKEELDNGYLWANEEKMEKLSLSGPHRKWIEEIQRDSDRVCDG